MLSAFVRAFKTPDLRRKLLFTIGIIVVYRFGAYLPTPGVDVQALQTCTSGAAQNTLLGMANLFSGGGLTQLSVFALGIMPYITASIIIQLLRVVIPRFEALHKEGQSGTTKLTQYTRYLTIGLAILQSTTVIATARSGALFGNAANCQNLLTKDSVLTVLIMIITMTAGTGLIMWLGELITEHGVGNGMSILIFTGIIANMPANMLAIWRSGSAGPAKFLVVLAVFVVVIVAIVFVEQSQRRIPVQYAKRMVGRRMYGGSSTYIPIKINMAGVIPVIFASSLLALPGLIAQFGDRTKGWARWIDMHLGSTAPLHIVLYALLIIFFCYFYTSITFNPEEVSDNMKKYGGFIPGYRAGKPTEDYLRYVINRINAPGALYLTLVALIPTLMVIWLGISNHLPFGGTTLLIIVGVGLETVKQIESQLQQRHYEGFLR